MEYFLLAGFIMAGATLASLTLGGRVPNWFTAVVAVCGIGAFFLGGRELSDLPLQLGIVAAIFTVTFILLMNGAMGAGASKLITAVSFWIPFELLKDFLFYQGIGFGLVAIVVIVLAKAKICKSSDISVAPFLLGISAFLMLSRSDVLDTALTMI